jgi:hypothetical protein
MSEGLRAAGRKAIKKSKKKAGPIESQPGASYLKAGADATDRRRSTAIAAQASAKHWRAAAVAKGLEAARFRGNWVPEIQKHHQISYVPKTAAVVRTKKKKKKKPLPPPPPQRRSASSSTLSQLASMAAARRREEEEEAEEEAREYEIQQARDNARRAAAASEIRINDLLAVAALAAEREQEEERIAAETKLAAERIRKRQSEDRRKVIENAARAHAAAKAERKARKLSRKLARDAIRDDRKVKADEAAWLLELAAMQTAALPKDWVEGSQSEEILPWHREVHEIKPKGLLAKLFRR